MNPKHPVEGEELQAYLDNELGRERRQTVEQHVAACADCQRLLDDLRQVSARLQAWQIEPAPEQLRAPREARHGGHAPERRLLWRWALAFGGVAATLLIVAGLTIPNLLRSRMPVEPSARLEQKERDALDLAREPAAPAATARSGRRADRAAEARADKDEAVDSRVQPGALPAEGRVAKLAASRAVPPMIAHEVSLVLTVKDFDAAKQALLAAVEQAGGYVAQAASSETPEQPRRADLVVRIPVEQLSATLEAVRRLGRVTQEQQTGEEVTAQYVDLEARLGNARATERRLVRVLTERTGKVRDILEVEREIARVREEIERMEAQRKHLEHRVARATLRVALVEEFQAKLAPAPVGTRARLRNAFVEGYENLVGTLLGLLIFFGRHGLVLLFWGAVGWLGWRSVRGRLLLALRELGWGSPW